MTATVTDLAEIDAGAPDIDDEQWDALAEQVAAASAAAAGSGDGPPPASAPDAPQDVTVTAGDARLDVVWDAPDGDGGADIVSYTVTVDPADADPVTHTDLDTLAVTVTGPANGTAHTVSVVADNAAGTSTAATATGTPQLAIAAGTVVVWTGDPGQVPDGWQLADGSDGTPDLAGRFLVGAGGDYTVGDVGGAASVTLTAAQLPEHAHDAGSLTAAAAGGHGHDAGSLAADLGGTHSHSSGSLATGTAGSHTHTGRYRYFSQGTGGVDFWTEVPPNRTAGTTKTSRNTNSSGSHSHSISGSTGSAGSHTHAISGSTGSGGAYTHAISGSTGSVGAGAPIDNRPPYHAVAYLVPAAADPSVAGADSGTADGQVAYTVDLTTSRGHAGDRPERDGPSPYDRTRQAAGSSPAHLPSRPVLTAPPT